MPSQGGRASYLITSAAIAASVALIAAAGAAAAAGGNPAGALYVSPHGSGAAAGKNCGTATFSRIGDAVTAASAGGTVVVCPGTYLEHVLIDKALTLAGQNATIDATGLDNAIQVVASDVSVSGFTAENAQGEGVLVGVDTPDDAHLLSSQVLSNVTIDHVTALNDDKGFNGTEESICQYPGDCGGGIHLNVAANSTVSNSQVVGNADGILLTDDYGPNHNNLIVGNYVADNKTECGIVLPGHNGNAVSFAVNSDGSMTVTGRNPTLGGVYDNVVRDNVTIDNGTATAPPEFGGVGGSGGGVGIFGSFPGAGAYDNLVEGNTIAGNGLAGVTIHAHHPGGSDVNGNQIINNTFDTNNVMGDAFDGGISNFQTTAIAVYSVPTAEMTISGNAIRNNSIGIWLTDTVDALGLDNNKYAHVGTPVVIEPAN
jgi:parallel beta-helix repeat protein